MKGPPVLAALDPFLPNALRSLLPIRSKLRLDSGANAAAPIQFSIDWAEGTHNSVGRTKEEMERGKQSASTLPGEWADIGESKTGTGSELEFTSGAPSSGQSFYRLKVE